MPLNEKITFLMETIPTEQEVRELKRRYLLNNIEFQLLLDASHTLQTSAPDENLIEWAYAILRIYREKRKKADAASVPFQTKMERIAALFSTPEDLQRILNDTSWDASEKRNFQLVSHFVTHKIPLASNAKIVEKVYDLLDNSYLPNDLAVKYFGKKSFSGERDLILEKYLNYRKRKETSRTAETYVPQRRDNPLKRYTYILGALFGIAFLFLSGFFTAKLIYEGKPSASTHQTADSGKEKTTPGERTDRGTHRTAAATEKELEQRFVVSRVSLQKGLENYGLSEKIDFATKLLAEGASAALPHIAAEKGMIEHADSRLPSEKEPIRPFKGALKVAVTELGQLHGLELPLKIDERNISVGVPLPKDFRLHASESSSSRVIYLKNGEQNIYPVEIYSFTTEPIITEFRLINFKPGHYISVPSNIWHFSNTGEMRIHRHFVYQGNRVAPMKVITNYFLPGGETVETVSVEKIDRNMHSKELLLTRRDYLPSAKLLYREDCTIDRKNGRWRNRPVYRVWYDEGKKILAKGTAPSK